jgi:hypothetical protein
MAGITDAALLSVFNMRSSTERRRILGLIHSWRSAVPGRMPQGWSAEPPAAETLAPRSFPGSSVPGSFPGSSFPGGFPSAPNSALGFAAAAGDQFAAVPPTPADGFQAGDYVTGRGFSDDDDEEEEEEGGADVGDYFVLGPGAQERVDELAARHMQAQEWGVRAEEVAAHQPAHAALHHWQRQMGVRGVEEGAEAGRSGSGGGGGGGGSGGGAGTTVPGGAGRAIRRAIGAYDSDDEAKEDDEEEDGPTYEEGLGREGDEDEGDVFDDDGDHGHDERGDSHSGPVALFSNAATAPAPRARGTAHGAAEAGGTAAPAAAAPAVIPSSRGELGAWTHEQNEALVAAVEELVFDFDAASAHMKRSLAGRGWMEPEVCRVQYAGLMAGGFG